MINELYANAFCKEDIAKIENYEQAKNDTTQTWDLHHRTEIWWNCSSQELKDNECYYHRPSKELIFLTRSEHTRLHNKGKHRSEEIRKKLSESMKGKHLSDEAKRKIGDAHKGKHWKLVDGRRVYE